MLRELLYPQEQGTLPFAGFSIWPRLKWGLPYPIRLGLVKQGGRKDPLSTLDHDQFVISGCGTPFNFEITSATRRWPLSLG